MTKQHDTWQGHGAFVKCLPWHIPQGLRRAIPSPRGRVTCSGSCPLPCGILCSLRTESSFRAGSLHVGDEILEINGTNVTNHSVDQLQKAMVGIFCFCVCEVWMHIGVSGHCFPIKSLYLTKGTLPAANLCSVQEVAVLYFHLVHFSNKANGPQYLPRTDTGLGVRKRWSLLAALKPGRPWV